MRARITRVTTSQPTAQAQRGLERHAGEGAGAAGEVDGVDQDDVDDDQEAEGGDRDEIAGKTHQRRADDDREHHADEPRHDGGGQEGEAERGKPGRQVGQIGVLGGERQRQDAGDVGADRDEADMAEREDAGEAVGNPHRGDQDGVDAHHGHDADDVVVEEFRQDQRRERR